MAIDWTKTRAFRRRWWDVYEEEPKDHETLPDGLGVGVREERQGDGLYIYLDPPSHHLTKLALTPYIVLGKYLEPQYDGSLYYVADWTKKGVNAHTTKKFDHLMLAISAIYELAETYETERTSDANLQD